MESTLPHHTQSLSESCMSYNISETMLGADHLTIGGVSGGGVGGEVGRFRRGGGRLEDLKKQVLQHPNY